MSKQEIKLKKYLKGMSKTLSVLSDEIKERGKVDKDDIELISKIGSNIIFTACSYDYLT